MLENLQMYHYVLIIGFVLYCLVLLACFCGVVYLVVLVIKALRKYLRSGEVREEKNAIKRSLGETLRSYRENNKMTQEFVAEALGVSRQAVSKWENGASDPSTSNLIALAKLYGTTAEMLLRSSAGEGIEI